MGTPAQEEEKKKKNTPRTREDRINDIVGQSTPTPKGKIIQENFNPQNSSGSYSKNVKTTTGNNVDVSGYKKPEVKLGKVGGADENGNWQANPENHYNLAQIFKPKDHTQEQSRINKLEKIGRGMDVFRSVAEGVGAFAGSSVFKRGKDGNVIQAQQDREQLEGLMAKEQDQYRLQQLKDALMESNKQLGDQKNVENWNDKLDYWNINNSQKTKEIDETRKWQKERDEYSQGEQNKRNAARINAAKAKTTGSGGKPYFSVVDYQNRNEIPLTEGKVYWLLGALKEQTKNPEEAKVINSFMKNAADPNTAVKIKAYLGEKIVKNPEVLDMVYQMSGYEDNPYGRQLQAEQLARNYNLKTTGEPVKESLFNPQNFTPGGWGQEPQYAAQEQQNTIEPFKFIH